MKTLEKILCIDDDQDICLVAKMSLETVGGFDVVTASSGIEGIKLALNYKPDIIIVDYMMPEMDGPKTFKEIRKIKALKNIPVIFMTARVQETEISEYLALGADAVISKPFDPMKLAPEVKKIWDNISSSCSK